MSTAAMVELFSLAGRTALVTGASRGLGLDIARGFIAHGARVYLVARAADAVEGAAESLRAHGEAHALAADLSRIDEIERVAGYLGRREQSLHILVNNAAAVWNAPLGSFPLEGWDKVVNLNLRSPFFLIQRLLPLLRAGARSKDGPARIINIASTDALHVPITDTYSYTAAKAGLVMLTRMLGERLGREGVTVNAVAPGPFPTKMTAQAFAARGAEFLAQVPLGRYGTAEDIAGAAIFLASRAGAYVNGVVLPVDGGLTGGR